MTNRATCVLSAAILSLVGANNVRADEPALVRVADLLGPAIVLAQRSSRPVGIVVSKEELCRTVISPQKLESTDLERVLHQITEVAGGVELKEGDVVVLSLGNPPRRLVTTLNHNFSRFPALNGTKPYFGALLNGWLKSTLPGNTGFAVDVASSVEEPQERLSESLGLSVKEIANKIVLLGKRGFWIASDNESESTDPEASMSITVYPYPTKSIFTEITCHPNSD